jgi:hypothetical protein
MDTETLTKLPTKIERSYFIVFDTDGGIRKINSTPVDNIDEELIQVETKNPICKKLIQGKASLKKYGMIWDIVKEKWDIDVRSTTLVIESKHNKLLPFIQNLDPTTTELFVNIFYNTNEVLVEINRDIIKSLKNLSDITEISTNETKLLDIYITKKGDPDYLINTIEIDPLPLFARGKQVIDLNSSITDKLDWQDISLYAKPVFENYGWSLQGTEKSRSTGRDKVLQQSTSKAEEKDININVVDNVLYLSSRLTKAQLYYFDGQTKLRIVVCDRNIDNLVGAFEVPVENLLNNTSVTDIKFKWPREPLLLYKNNYVTIATGEKV